MVRKGRGWFRIEEIYGLFGYVNRRAAMRAIESRIARMSSQPLGSSSLMVLIGKNRCSGLSVSSRNPYGS